MLRSARFPALVLILAIVITGFQTPRLAAAAYTWYGASLFNWSFTRANGTPLMFQQDTCYKCTASGTAAWQEYTWVAQGNNTHSPNPYPNGAQDDMWNYMMTSHTWSYAAGGDNTVSVSCTGSAYPRRAANISKDDGSDPYAQAWGIYHYTPSSYYYHMIRYEDGASYTGYYTGSHSIAATLSHYQEPVGTFIGNGQHFVLTTAIEADQDPNVNFYANILNVLIRDPLLSPGASPYTGNRTTYAYDTNANNSWFTKFTRYGWNGTGNNSWNTAPHTTGAGSGYVDDPEVGSFVNRPSSGNGYKGFWWGHYVAVKRDDTATSPTDTAWFFAQ